MQINLNKKDVIWSYIGTFMSIASNILMLPLVIHFLDTRSLGLWYVFSSIGAIASLFDFGFGITFARNITYSWSGAKELKKENVSFVGDGEPDFCLMKKVLVACKIVYLRLSGLSLLLLLTLGTFYISYISDNQDNVYIPWFIFSLAVFLNLYYGYYAAFLRGVGAITDTNKNMVIARITQFLFTIILLVTGLGLLGVCIAYLFYGTTFRILGKYKFYSFKNIGLYLSKIEDNFSSNSIKSLISVVWYNAWRDGVIAISNYLSYQSSIIICSLFFSLSITGSYSVGVQIGMAIATVSGTLYSAYQPQLSAAYINYNIDLLRKTMSIIVCSMVYFYIIIFIIVLITFIPILRYIRPEAIVPIPILTGICIYYFILKFRDCYTTFFSCSNRVIYMKSFVFSSLFGIVLSVILLSIFKFDIWGLIISQILSQLVFNAWYWPLAAHRELKTSFLHLVREGNSLLLNLVIMRPLKY